MRIRLESAKQLGRKLGLNEDKGFAVAIFLALLIISISVLVYFVWFRPQAEPYNTIYLLDSNKKALDYPATLVAKPDSTFDVYVNVVNHEGKSESYKVLVKIASNLSEFPVDAQPIQTYDLSLKEGETWQNSVSITQNQIGTYSVVFELWQQNSGTFEFTNNYCVLNI